MRFSLKWILAGTAYAALAAAALTQESSVYADLLWLATFVAFAFALVVASFARGPRQISAASFIAFSGCYLVCLHFAEASVPTTRLLLAWRLGDNANAPPQPPVLRTPTLPSVPMGMSLAERQARAQYLAAVRAAEQTQAVRPKPIDLTPYLRAGHAVATMGFGLLGCLLGLLAIRAAKPNTGTTGE
jgi:hypothetical protein